MIKLVINNSYSNISGLSASQQKELINLLSYVVGGSSAYFSGYGPRRKSCLSKRGDFPTGLRHRVENWLRTLKTGWMTSNKCRIAQCSDMNEDFSGAYEWQVMATKAAVRHSRGIISAPTGTGKSRAIAMVAKQIGLKTLVVVPSVEIKKQLSETVKDLKNVRVENIDNPKLKDLTDFDCLIIDECHHAAAKTYQKLNKTAWTNIYYRFCFTATPFRNDTEETLLFESICGKVIYSIDYATAVAKKYIVPVEAYYLDMPKEPTDAFTWSEVYSELVVHNDIRNSIIATLINKLQNTSISAICLVKEIAHGKRLSVMTGLPFVYGADDESRDYIRQFNNKDIKVLIGTTGILGEGVDSKPAEYIIVAGLGKAKSQFMQAVGRAVRTYPGKESAKIVLIRDSSHKFTLRHFNVQAKILKEEYGIKPVKLELE